MDERQQLTAGKAALGALFCVMIGAIAVLGWEYVTTKEVTNTAAIITVLGAGGLFWVFQIMFGAEAPRSMFGKELPTGPTPAERRTRTVAYLIDSLAFTIAMTVLALGGYFLVGDKTAAVDIAGMPFLAALALGAIALFAISFALTWALGEAESRAVERRIARLEA